MNLSDKDFLEGFTAGLHRSGRSLGQPILDGIKERTPKALIAWREPATGRNGIEPAINIVWNPDTRYVMFHEEAGQ